MTRNSEHKRRRSGSIILNIFLLKSPCNLVLYHADKVYTSCEILWTDPPYLPAGKKEKLDSEISSQFWIPVMKTRWRPVDSNNFFHQYRSSSKTRFRINHFLRGMTRFFIRDYSSPGDYLGLTPFYYFEKMRGKDSVYMIDLYSV